MSVDPLAPEYPCYSPYQFSGNRLIDMIELEGLEPAVAGKEDGEQQTAAYTGEGDNNGKDYLWQWDTKSSEWNASLKEVLATGKKKELNSSPNPLRAEYSISYLLLDAPIVSSNKNANISIIDFGVSGKMESNGEGLIDY